MSASFRLLDSLNVPTFVVDRRGIVLHWNVACERLTRVAAAEIAGVHQPWTAFYDYPRPCLADFIAQERQAELPVWYPGWDEAGITACGLTVEMRCRLPRVDRLLHLVIDAGPVFDDDGRLVGGIETMCDVTAQREAYDALQVLATRDSLTGLANRRRLDTVLETEVSRCARENRPLSLMMIDVDCFKAFNDTYGHQAGDTCLRSLADAIRRAVGCDGITPARYGGEEFAVVLPERTGETAERIADRILMAVESLDIPHLSSSVGRAVTVSIGVATLQGRELCASDLLAAADEALYSAKRRGRNRCASGSMPVSLALFG